MENELLQNVIKLIVSAITLGGGLWTVFGVIILAGGLKDKNGPGIQSGIWQIVGGVLVIASTVLLNSLVL